MTNRPGSPRAAVLAFVAVAVAALAAVFVLRDATDAREQNLTDEPEPSRPGDGEPPPRAHEPPPTPTPEPHARPSTPDHPPPSPAPVARDADPSRDEIRRRLLEADTVTPSSWPPLPSDYIRSGMIRDLGPLVGECMCEVHPSEEKITVHLDFTLISAPEIGGVIEAVDPREGNQAAGPLLDCITESAFSVALPPASSRGFTKVRLVAGNEDCDKYLAEAANTGDSSDQ